MMRKVPFSVSPGGILTTKDVEREVFIKKVNLEMQKLCMQPIGRGQPSGGRPILRQEMIFLNLTQGQLNIWCRFLTDSNGDDENIISDAFNSAAEMQAILGESSGNKILNELQVIEPPNECWKNIFTSLLAKNALQVATKDDKKLWDQERRFRITASRCFAYILMKKMNGNWKLKNIFDQKAAQWSKIFFEFCSVIYYFSTLFVSDL